ncbi:MAG TPA: prolipoprotein diacylglyceryl transferase [Candidatus Baltobacteraceae bacterium]|nr:prolipoprotein diacylglyceryl transferase [Candidatus Baltobacteraceae bacterium]
MIPYVAWKTIALGPVTLQVWGLFAAIGVVSAAALGSRLAKRKGLDAGKIESLAFWTIVAAFIGARAFHVLFYEPGYYFAHPGEILSVWKGGLSSFGGFFGAAIVAAWRIRRLGLPFWKTADIAVPATVLGLGCGRIGCFLIHDHPGTLAHGAGRWFAVNYPDGPRYDLGLLLGAVDFALFGAMLLLMRKPRPEGSMLVLFLLAYAPIRFGLDFLRAVDVRYAGLTPGQYGSVLLFIIGLFMMRRVYAKPASGNL